MEDDHDGVSTIDLIKEIVVEGLELMVVDLAVQLSITITVYVAASQGFQDVYKLAAAQAAYPVLGPSYLVGTMLFFKVMGARMVSLGRF